MWFWIHTGFSPLQLHADPALNLEIETGTGGLVSAEGSEGFIPDRLPAEISILDRQ